MNITLVSVSDAALADVVTSYFKKEKWFKEKVNLSIYYAGNEFSHEQIIALGDDSKKADFILIDLMGAPRQVELVVLNACQKAVGYIVPFGGDNSRIRKLLNLGQLSGKVMGMSNDSENVMPENMYKMLDMAEKVGKTIPFGILRDVRNYIFILKYWKQAGEKNIGNMLDLVAREYGKYKEIKMPAEPEVQDKLGFYDFAEEKVYATFAEYKQKVEMFDGEKPIIIVLFHSYSYPYRMIDCVEKITKWLAEFAQVIPIVIARNTGDEIDKLKEICNEVRKAGTLHLIINFLAFRLGAGPMGGDAQKAVDLLEQLDVPVIHPFFIAKGKIKDWQQSKEGLTPGEFLVSVMLPELDGSIEMMPVGGMSEINLEHPYDIEIRKLEIIPQRMEAFVNRIKGWLSLRCKDNKDKRVAFICYNYPPGEDNIFGGAFLDTFASMEVILKYLKVQGYNLPDITVEELKNQFRAGKLVNSGRWSTPESEKNFITYDTKSYLAAIRDDEWAADNKKQWGQPPGGIMTTEQGEFLIPGMITGNIFIGLQPTRGIHENSEENLHSKELPPHHQYIAFYRWLKEVFQADVIVHVGTHGTLEFLPGKEYGMSDRCMPDVLTGGIPHSYLYYVGNPSEAMIAKRRGRAVLVSYQPPPFLEGQLYGEYEGLYHLVQQLDQVKHLNPDRYNALQQLIITKAQQLNLPEKTELLERELYRMRRSLIPHGLHIFGQKYTAEQATDYMQQILRYDHDEAESLRRILAEDWDHDYEKLQVDGNVEVLAQLDKGLQGMIQQYRETKAVPDIFKYQTNKLRCMKTMEYGMQAYENFITGRELEGLGKVLAGRFLPARLAGDSMRTPAILPTGFNLYQFDARMVPSQTAYLTGAKIAENTIRQYWEETGTWPTSTAVVLWGLETARTQGETLGQVMHYLGVRPLQRSGGLNQRYEIISLAELGRPRIDVVISMCGFFRDMFPNMIDDLNYIVGLVANLDEVAADNYCKEHTDNLYTKLLEQGHDHQAASDLATARIFGPSRGTYGTGITSMLETKRWNNGMELADNYITSLRYVYSPKVRGQDVPGLFESCLQKVDIVSQLRSSHEYEIIDLDHYYEFFGGLAKSVEKSKGKKASMYISDTTGEQVETEQVQHSIARGVRTRLLNPLWIDGMLKHDYHGAQKIADRFENILGLAATTDHVEQWVFQKLYKVYVCDDNMRQRMVDNNPWAYRSCLETLLEYQQRDYWQANEEELTTVREVYLEVEGNIEEGE